MNKVDKKIIKNLAWNTIGTSLNSFNSLFFLIIVTWINGIENAGIFAIGAAIAVILYTIGEYSGRLFQVTDTKNEIKDKDYICSRIITLVSVIILSFIIAVLRKYDLYKTGIVVVLSSYRALEAFSEVLYGILQKHDMLYKVGQSYTIKSLASLVVFFIIDYLTKNLLYACVSLAIVYLISIVVFDIINLKKIVNWNYKVNYNNVRNIFKKEFFVFANSFAGVYILNSQKYVIDIFYENNIQAIYGYIMMPASVINLFSKFVVMPFLGNFKEYVNTNNIKGLKKLLFKMRGVIVIFGVCCTLGAAIIGPEILGIIYKTDLKLYRVELCIIIVAYILYSISYLDLVVLTTLRKTLIQFVIYILSMIVAFVTSYILVKEFQIMGGALACIITLGLLCAMYKIVLDNNIKKLNNK